MSQTAFILSLLAFVALACLPFWLEMWDDEHGRHRGHRPDDIEGWEDWGGRQ